MLFRFSTFLDLRNLLFCLYPVYWILRTQLACELLRDVVDLQVLRYLCANAVAARYIIYRIYFAFCIPMSFGGVSDAARRQFPLPFTAWEVNFHLQSELGSWLGTTTVTFGSQVWLLKHLECCHFVWFESYFAVATYILSNSVQFNADAQMLSWIHGSLMVIAFRDRQSGTKLSTTCLVLCWAHFSTPYPALFSLTRPTRI